MSSAKGDLNKLALQHIPADPVAYELTTQLLATAVPVITMVAQSMSAACLERDVGADFEDRIARLINNPEERLINKLDVAMMLIHTAQRLAHPPTNQDDWFSYGSMLTGGTRSMKLDTAERASIGAAMQRFEPILKPLAGQIRDAMERAQSSDMGRYWNLDLVKPEEALSWKQNRANAAVMQAYGGTLEGTDAGNMTIMLNDKVVHSAYHFGDMPSGRPPRPA